MQAHDGTEGVKLFLQRLNLEQYLDIFIAKGFDREFDIPHISTEDLDSMKIKDSTHRELILKNANHHTPSAEGKLHQWLVEHGLEHYYANFKLTDQTDMDNIRLIDTEKKENFEDLEITLPGHKKRLHRAVTRLRKQRRLLEEAENAPVDDPVVIGYWGRPVSLPETENDFLCVLGSIKSVQDTEYLHCLEFMVDSGSDVVTIDETTMSQLSLDLIGTCQSQGIHATKPKQLFKAMLKIGNQEIEIEAITERYNSVGVRVLQHFRHFINGTRHFWLPPKPSTALPSTPVETTSTVDPQSSTSQAAH